MVEIPLQGGSVNAHQVFFVQLGENYLEFRVNYLTRFDMWSMDILLEGVNIANGAALVAGANITRNFSADIGKLVFVGEDTTLDNLGKSNHLVWSSE